MKVQVIYIYNSGISNYLHFTKLEKKRKFIKIILLKFNQIKKYRNCNIKY